jgi:hypothetical protein
MSSKSYLKASIKFFDSSLDGGGLAKIARSYRPLLKLNDEYLTSCFFEKIGDGFGTMKLDTSYEVLISLHMRKQMEEFIGKLIHEILPVGRDLEIVTADRTVAKGKVEGILEVDVGADNSLNP